MKIQVFFSNVGNFINEVGQELKKSTWPTRSELLHSTMVVILSMVVLAAFVGLSDLVVMKLLRIFL